MEISFLLRLSRPLLLDSGDGETRPGRCELLNPEEDRKEFFVESTVDNPEDKRLEVIV